MAGRAKPALRVHHAGMASVANINDVIEGHVGLEVECVDRLVLNAYVPKLQVGSQVARFITGHLGKPIASAAVLGAIGNRFRRDVRRYIDAHQIPVLRLKAPDRSRWDDRKLDHARPYLEAAERERRYGVVAIVAGEEYEWVFSARNRSRTPKTVWFEFFRERRRVGVYYFYRAARRPVVSPAQPGGTRRESLGLMADRDPRGERDNRMPGNRLSCPGVRGEASWDPCDMAKAGSA